MPLVLNIRYGSRVIELAKGKSSIELAGMDDLVPTFELVKRAVEAGSWTFKSMQLPTSFAIALVSD